MCATNKLLFDVQLRPWLLRQSLSGFCFELPIVLPQGHHGVWTSQHNRRTLRIANDLRLAVGCACGSATSPGPNLSLWETKLAILDCGLPRWKLLLCRVHDFTKPLFSTSIYVKDTSCKKKTHCFSGSVLTSVVLSLTHCE